MLIPLRRSQGWATNTLLVRLGHMCVCLRGAGCVVAASAMPWLMCAPYLQVRRWRGRGALAARYRLPRDALQRVRARGACVCLRVYMCVSLRVFCVCVCVCVCVSDCVQFVACVFPFCASWFDLRSSESVCTLVLISGLHVVWWRPPCRLRACRRYH